jgi:hypothetical protein
MVYGGVGRCSKGEDISNLNGINSKAGDGVVTLDSSIQQQLYTPSHTHSSTTTDDHKRLLFVRKKK